MNGTLYEFKKTYLLSFDWVEHFRRTMRKKELRLLKMIYKHPFQLKKVLDSLNFQRLCLRLRLVERRVLLCLAAGGALL